ncbi:MAG: glycogen synthase GlgA [Myxococcaceae bacterium]
MRILFLSSEVAPFSKTGGLGDVAKALPAALARAGHEVRVVTPLYGTVRGELMPTDVMLRLRFPFGVERAGLAVARAGTRHEVWFIDHPGYYRRPALYGTDWDEHRRFGFFSVAALQAAQGMGFAPDIIHLNDWQCGLAAVALQGRFAATALGSAAIVFTIHNLAYQGNFPKSVMEDLGLPWALFNADGLEFYDTVNFMKAGITTADAVTTVSPRYAQEIQTQEYGCMLEGVLRSRADRLTGILNGIDDEEWDPAQDRLLPARYDAFDFSGKAVCKAQLRRRFALPEPDRLSSRPLFGLVSRLTAQKGIDLILATVPWLLSRAEAEVVLLGNGDEQLERGLLALAARFPGRVGVHIGFDNRLSHLVEAGADFFLMPSRYEPCGLNQMYSLRYGTIPLVRATGGLDDTVTDAALPGGDGLKFHHIQPDALAWAMGRALEVWRSPEVLEGLRRRGMAKDFSWRVSAGRYEQLYTSLVG